MQVLHVAFIVVAWSLLCTALPTQNRRIDVSPEDDDEPFASDLESDMMDQIAEESETYETYVPAEDPSPFYRGGIKFSEPADHAPLEITTTPVPNQEEVNRAEKERALMLVLPYNTQNLSESKIQELYTKRPVTWLINTTTTEAPLPSTKTERTSTTVVVTPTPNVKWRPILETTTTPAPLVIRDDVKDLLASIGLFPSKSTTRAIDFTTQNPKEYAKNAADSLSPDMKNLLSSFGLLDGNKAAIPSPIKFEEPVENTPAPYVNKHVQPEIDPSSYSVFKPIPKGWQNQEMNSDMKDFLANFGLVDVKEINSKKETSHIKPRGKQLFEKSEVPVTVAPTGIPTLHPDSMTAEMKQVLYTLGMAPNVNPDEFDMIVPAEDRSINSASIFSPTASVQNVLNNTEDAQNLKKLLDTYKVLSKNSTSPEDIEKQLQDATKFLSEYNQPKIIQQKGNSKDTLDNLFDAPDPLSYEELLFTLNDAKNEVSKRQETNNATDSQAEATDQISSSSTTTTTTTTTASTTTEEEEESEAVGNESKTDDTTSDATSGLDSTASGDEDTSENNNSASFADLESSFGGSPSDSTNIDESLPPPKPNGFYFLLDWNSFLNVGEDDKGVHLKFAPRAGNSKNFLPITVP